MNQYHLLLIPASLQYLFISYYFILLTFQFQLLWYPSNYLSFVIYLPELIVLQHSSQWFLDTFFLDISFDDCLMNISSFVFFVNISASLFSDWTNIILIIPSSTCSFTNLYLISICLSFDWSLHYNLDILHPHHYNTSWLDILIFIFINSRIILNYEISVLTSDSATYSASVDYNVMLFWALLSHETKHL